MIAVLGTISALLLIWDLERWALAVAIAAQPAWFWAAYGAEQWGELYNYVVYSTGWSLLLWRARLRHAAGATTPGKPGLGQKRR